MRLSARATVELFHLVFLRALVAKGEDKGLIALKGGCNLRFYFVKNKVDRLLRSPLVLAPSRDWKRSCHEPVAE